MSVEVKFRRGTTSQHSSFTGSEGEITIDMTKDTAVVHDGTTAGGHPLATEANLTAGIIEAKDYSDSQIEAAFDAVTAADIPTSDSSNVQSKLNSHMNRLDGHDSQLTTITALSGLVRNIVSDVPAVIIPASGTKISVEVGSGAVSETVEVSNRNLIVPLTPQIVTSNGVTFTFNVDGSVFVNGTATAGISIRYGGGGFSSATKDILSGFTGRLTLSGGTFKVAVVMTHNNANVTGVRSQGLTVIRDAVNLDITGAYLTVSSGVTVSNETVYPMLEISEEAGTFIKGTRQKKTLAITDGVGSETFDAYDGLNYVFSSAAENTIEFRSFVSDAPENPVAPMNVIDVDMTQKPLFTARNIELFGGGGYVGLSVNDNDITMSAGATNGGLAIGYIDHPFTPDGGELLHIRFKVSGLTELSGYVAPTVQYIGVVAGSSTGYYNTVATITEDGDYDISIDPAYYAVYQGFTTAWLAITGTNFSLVLEDFEVIQNPAYDAAIYDETIPKVIANTQNALDAINLRLDTESAGPTETMKIAANGAKYVLQVSDVGALVPVPVIPTKALWIGNSLLMGHITFGMAASDNQHDYHYYLSQHILAKNANFTDSKLKANTFEGCTTDADVNSWLSGTLLPYLTSDLDLVVVQLGDNVNTAERVTEFERSAKMLLAYIRAHCPQARVVWVGEWYSTAAKQSIIASACTSTGCKFVDIGDLYITANQSALGNVVTYDSAQSKTYTVDSYTDNGDGTVTIVLTLGGIQYTRTITYDSITPGTGTLTVVSTKVIITDSAVASHPGDAGHVAIANRIGYETSITDNEETFSL